MARRKENSPFLPPSWTAQAETFPSAGRDAAGSRGSPGAPGSRDCTWAGWSKSHWSLGLSSYAATAAVISSLTVALMVSSRRLSHTSTCSRDGTPRTSLLLLSSEGWQGVGQAAQLSSQTSLRPPPNWGTQPFLGLQDQQLFPATKAGFCGTPAMGGTKLNSAEEQFSSACSSSRPWQSHLWDLSTICQQQENAGNTIPAEFSISQAKPSLRGEFKCQVPSPGSSELVLPTLASCNSPWRKVQLQGQKS